MSTLSFEKFSKNPLTAIFLGFILTTIIGTIITTQINENQSKRDRENHERDANNFIITQISEVMFQRFAASELLYSALERDAPLDEIISKKKIYDDAFLKWNTKSTSIKLEAQNINRKNNLIKFNRQIDSLTVLFQKVDEGLTDWYDTKVKNKYEKLNNNKITSADFIKIGDYFSGIYSLCNSITKDLWDISNIKN